MRENDIELSRRKVLAGLGTIGLASAGAGLGTTAYFSDEETFKNNTLTAGALDLTVDWEEHYSDWSSDEAEGVDVRMDEPENTATNYVGFPDPENPMVYIAEGDIQTFQDNTAIEAYPDDNNDGIQDPVLFGDEENGDEYQYVPCEDFAQTPEDLDPDGGTGLRSLNADTVANWPLEDEDAEPAPLVNLQDLKPGDFGELTLSFHLCDNPGYVWLTGDLVDASENGLTEPERKDPDEEEGVVELLDEVQTLLWYDEDGDNVYEPGGEAGEADIVLVLDESGSMDGGALSDAQDAAINLINTVGANAQVSVVGFDDDVTMYQQLTTTKSDAIAAVNSLSAGGSTNIEEAIDVAHEEVDGHDVHPTYDASGNDRDAAESIIVLLTDGSPNVDVDYDDDSTTTPFEAEFGEADPADNADFATQNPPHVNTIYTVGFGGVTSGSDEAALLEYMATDPSNAFIGAQDELFEIFAQIAQQIAGEKCFFRGSLRELLDELGMGSDGVPLDGDRTSNFDEVPGDGTNEEAPSDPTSPERECFVPSTTNAIGLAWWLPVDHANEIQTDSVSFDLGFYTEQCRHNAGAGMAPEYTQGTVGSGDFSQISYEKAFSMQALSRAGSGRGEIQIHGDSGGVENTTLWGSNTGDTFPANTDVPFTATVDPDAETASLTINGVTVTDDDVTDGDANAESTGESEWPGGVPDNVDVAITASSGDANVTTVVKDVTVNGNAVDPGSISATDDLSFLEIVGIPASTTVSVEGVLRFEGSTGDFDGQDFVGIDWR